MSIDFHILKKSYQQEFDLISKLFLKKTFPHSWVFHGPKQSGKRKLKFSAARKVRMRFIKI